MDTPTQALLGAVVGQAFFSRKLGRRALIWGALAGAVPDMDILPIVFLGPWGDVLYHRGPTHALWFGPLAGALLGYAVWKGYARKRKKRVGPEDDPDRQAHRVTNSSESESLHPHPGDPSMLGSWIGLFVLALLTHPLLDLFTSYGTQLLTPFSRHRFALQGVPIIDPVYSLILVASLVVWGVVPKERKQSVGRRTAAVALLLSTAYLFYGLWLNTGAEREVRQQLAGEGIYPAQIQSYPTIFQVFLRRVVVRAGDEVRVGWISMWNPGPVAWQRFTMQEHPLIEQVRSTWEGKTFEWFAMGEMSSRIRNEGKGTLVEIDDIRYGFFGPPDQGIWGIRARFDEEDRLLGEVRRFQRPYPSPWGTLGKLWRATFGVQ